ncbi:MAG: hypothetical protein KBB11_02030 [Bacteroidales bacterium]|nr:hypothetical protein [Bacteroidales bacterium]HOY39145.1 hypothetical protein [Bacteroidales bacterium]HQP03939.1 hypothetical protein [Bacteroidales bacterium]
MKKILYLSIAVVLTLSIASCKKYDVAKDVDMSILKLNQFNDKFAEFYKDEVISKDTLENEKSSEFDQLKKIAGEYYEIINKINSQIKEDQERVKNGKKSKGYEDDYKKALSEKNDAIEKSTGLFIENMNKLNGTDEINLDEVVPEQAEQVETLLVK